MSATFDRVAWGYGAFMRFWGLYREREVFELLDPQPEDRIIDLGGGTGRYAQALVGRCQQVVVVDESPQMLAKVPPKPGLQTLQCDLLTTGISTAWADAVLLCDVVHHSGKQGALMLEARRLVRSGGRMVIYDFERSHLLSRVLEAMETVLLPPVAFLSQIELEETARSAGWVTESLFAKGPLMFGLWRAP